MPRPIYATFNNHIFLLWFEHDITMYSSVVTPLMFPEVSVVTLYRPLSAALTDCYPIQGPPATFGPTLLAGQLTTNTPLILLVQVIVLLIFICLWCVKLNMMCSQFYSLMFNAQITLAVISRNVTQKHN